MVAACGAGTAPRSVVPGPDATADAGSDAAGPSPEPARLVMLISVDGLRADAVTAELMPFLHERQAVGATTLQARTDPTSSLTVPNHLCMVTGRPMDGPEGHHFTSNRYVDTILHEERGFYVVSAFDVAHDRGVATALVSGKTKLGIISHAYDLEHGAADVVGADDGRAKIDFVRVEAAGDDDTLAAGLEAVSTLPLPALVFLHLSEPDHTGHGEGFDPADGTPYADSVRATDERLATLAERLAAMPGLAGTPVAWVLTSDHGGHEYGHYDLTDAVDTTIPFFAWGAGAQAADLYAVNAVRRRDPGREAQPAEGAPIRNCEAGNLALALLGLPAIPGSVFGAAQDLRTRP